MKRTAIASGALLLLCLSSSAGTAQVPGVDHCFGTAPTIVGTPGDDRLRGTRDRDVIAGLDGDDRIFGLDGDDVLCGGPGNDIIEGGDGHDGIVVGDGRDRAFGNGDSDFIMEVTEGGSGGLIGGAVMTDDDRDVLSGGDAIDVISPEGGDDLVIGGSGLDIVDGMWVFDAVLVDLKERFLSSQSGGIDKLRSIEGAMGGFYNDTLLGDDSVNWLAGFLGQDEVDGRGDSDVLWSSIDGARLVGGDGQTPDTVAVALSEPTLVDLVAGSVRSMEFAHAHPPDVLIGIENVVTSDHNDIIFGSAFDDGLYGRGGHDWIHGGAGDDFVRGDGPVRLPLLPEWKTGSGNDQLDGGPGEDVLDGGPKEDRCVNGETVTSCESEERSARTSIPSSGLSVVWPGGSVEPWWWSRVGQFALHPDQGI